MNLDVTFEQSPWEMALDECSSGTSLSAARLLTLLEGESESDVEEAFQELERRRIMPDLSDLPKAAGVGEAAVRLRREEQLVTSGNWVSALEETDPLRLYLEELASIPTCGDVDVLARRLADGDRSVVEQLTTLMLGQVVECACAMTGRGVLLQDLIQEGSLGLWQGILEYTEGDLRQQCLWHIQFGMARLALMQARSAGVGQRMRQAMEDYRSVDERLLSDLGRNPTLSEIAVELHMTEDEAAAVGKMLDAARLLAQAKPPVEPVETEEDNQAVEDTAYFQMRQRISELLSNLDEEGVQLLTLRFGLEGGKPLSPEETGRKLGLTPEEVIAKEAKVLAKLRNI